MPATSPAPSARSSEAAPRPSEDRQSFLLGLSDALRPLDEPAKIQAEACRVLGERLHAARVLYVESDASGASMPGPQHTDGVPAMQGPLPLAAFDSILAERYRLGFSIVKNDVAGDPALTPEQKATFASHQIGSYIAVPMARSGGTAARLGVHHRYAHAWTDEELFLVQETAERLWAALERARVQTALRRSEERLRALVTANSNVVYRMSADWKHMLSMDGQDFPNDTRQPDHNWMDGYVHPEDQPLVMAAIEQAISTRSTFELEHRVRRADGTVGWTLSRAVPLLDAAGDITEWFGAARDVTARKRNEQALRETDERQAFLLQLSDSLRAVADPGQTKELAARALAAHLSLSSVGYAEVDRDGDTLWISGGYDGDRGQKVKAEFRLADFGAGFSAALHAGQEIFAADIAAAAISEALGIHALAALPLLKNNTLVACLYAVDARPRVWADTERQLLREVAERTWAAVERARAEEAIAADLRDTQLLRDLGARFLSEKSDVHELYREINEVARQLTHADAGTVQILDPHTHDLILSAAHGFPPDSAQRFGRVAAGSATSCGIALQSGARMFVDFDDTALEDPKGDLRWHVEAGYLSAQSTPLIARSGRAVGMVSTHWRRRWRPCERELRFLDLLARQAADLIEQWQSQHELRASEDRYRTLFDSIDEGFCLIEVLYDEAGHSYDYRFIEANPAFEKHTGLKDVLGRTVRELAPDHDEHWFEVYGRIVRTGHAERFELPAAALGRCYDVYAFRVGDEDMHRVAVLFDDITSRKLTEDILRQEAELDAFRVALGDALRALTDPTEVQAAAARVLGVHLQASRAVYGEVEHQEDSDYYILREDYHAPDAPSRVGRYRANDYGQTLFEEMRAGRTLVVSEAATDTRLSQAERQAHAATDVAAYICVPLLKEGRHMAFVCVDQSTPRHWTQVEIALVEETAERAWAAVESARYEQTLRQSEEQQAFLLALSDALRPLGRPEDIMSTAAEMLGRQLNATQVGYAETDNGESYLDILVDWTAEGRASVVGQHSLVSHDGEDIRSYQAGRPWVVEDAETDARQVVRDVAHVYVESGARATLNVPMVKEGRWVAMLYATSATARRWTPGEIELAREVAERTWAALELARAQQALREAKEAAELANRSKDRFLAVLSHELRTPLTPVLMTVDSLQHDATLSQTLREDLAMMKRNIQLETKLIDDLLDISRITSGKLVLHLAAVDLNDIVRNVCRICNPLVRERGMELHTRLARSAGVVNADSARVQQVLWNVLMNAIKFTPAGGSITVTTAWIDSSRCEVRVQDTGAGIAPEVLPHIFNAFEQGGVGVTRQFGGLGLGLAICKALVELHQGTIRAESPGAGQGAAFIIELPGRAMTATAKIRLAAPAAKVEAGHLRLLLVEDHPDTERVLAALLRRAGFTVVTAQNVTKAITTAREQAFDLLVSDLGLPDGTGYDVMRTVHSIQGIPGVAMSGFGMEEDLRRSREAGFSEHLVKPIDIAGLIDTIRRVAAKHVRATG